MKRIVVYLMISAGLAAPALADVIPTGKGRASHTYNASARAAENVMAGTRDAEAGQERSMALYVEEARPGEVLEPAAGDFVAPLDFESGVPCVILQTRGGGSMRLRVDTGCSAGIVLRSERRARIGLFAGDRRIVWVSPSQAPKLAFGDEDGLIGTGVLGRFAQVCLDRDNGTLILRPAR